MAYKNKSETSASSSNTIDSSALTVATGDYLLAAVASTVDCDAMALDAAGTPQMFTKVLGTTLSGYYGSLWRLENASAVASGVVTASVNGGNYNILCVWQGDGLLTSGALDQSSQNATNALSDSVNWTSQNVTTTQANEDLVFFGIGWENHSTWTGQNSYTVRTAGGTVNWVIADKSVTSTGSHPNGTVVTVSDETDDQYFSFFATLKSAGGGGASAIAADGGSHSLAGFEANLLHGGHGWLKYRKP